MVIIKQQLKQMMGRIRKIKHNIICYWNKITHFNYPTSFDDIKQRLTDKVNLHSSSISKYVTDDEIKLVRNGDSYSWELVDDFWMWLKIRNLQEKYFSKNYFDVLFDLMLTDQDFQITTVKVDQKKAKDIKNFNNYKKQLEKVIYDDKAKLFNQTTTPDVVELSEYTKLIEKGLASLDEFMAVKKWYFLYLFDTKYHDQITGDDFVILENKTSQLKNARIELDLSVKEVALIDLQMDRDPLFLQYSAIKDICQILGVDNTLDRETIIDGNVISDNLIFFQQKHPEYTSLFDLTNKVPSRRENVISLLNSILIKWSYCKLTQLGLPNKNSSGKRFYKYIFMPINQVFDKFVIFMSPVIYYNSTQIKMLNDAQFSNLCDFL